MRASPDHARDGELTRPDSADLVRRRETHRISDPCICNQLIVHRLGACKRERALLGAVVDCRTSASRPQEKALCSRLKAFESHSMGSRRPEPFQRSTRKPKVSRFYFILGQVKGSWCPALYREANTSAWRSFSFACESQCL